MPVREENVRLKVVISPKPVFCEISRMLKRVVDR